VYNCGNVDVCLTLYSMRCMLSALPSKKMRYRMSTPIFGRKILGIQQGSKETLTHAELQKFTHLLLRMFRVWDAKEFGWDIEESEGINFTITFLRRTVN